MEEINVRYVKFVQGGNGPKDADGMTPGLFPLLSGAVCHRIKKKGRITSLNKGLLHLSCYPIKKVDGLNRMYLTPKAYDMVIKAILETGIDVPSGWKSVCLK